MREEISMEADIERARERGPDARWAELDDEALTLQLQQGAADIAAATARWLQVLHEVVVRGIPGQWGFASPAAWLSWSVGMSRSTARDHVRVALRLPRFPRTADRFAAGELSFSKVRAITRADRPELEDTLLTYAECASASQLDKIVAHTRNLSHLYDGSDTEILDPWELGDCSLRYADHDTVVLKLRMPVEEGLRAHGILQQRAGAARRDALARQPDPAPEGPDDPFEGDAQDPPEGASAEAPTRPEDIVEPVLPMAAYKARAFVEACETIADGMPVDTSGLERHTLVLHADAQDVLAPEPRRRQGDADESTARPAAARRVRVRIGNHGRQAAMDPAVLRRLACQARYAIIGHSDEPGIAGVSGTSSTVPPRLRRALDARDGGGCRFPGCATSRHIEAHHIIHLADGGPTELANLVLLCRFHHQFVHRRHWEILHDGAGRFRFQPPGELPMPTTLPLPGASAEAPPTDPDRPADILLARAYEHRPNYSDAVAPLLEAIEREHAPQTIPLAA